MAYPPPKQVAPFTSDPTPETYNVNIPTFTIDHGVLPGSTPFRHTYAFVNKQAEVTDYLSSGKGVFSISNSLKA